MRKKHVSHEPGPENVETPSVSTEIQGLDEADYTPNNEDDCNWFEYSSQLPEHH